MDVDIADVAIKPLFHCVDESPPVRIVIAMRIKASLKPGQCLQEFLVRRLVLPGHGAPMCRHALFLKTKMTTTITFEVIEKYGIHLVTQPVVKSSAKVSGHLKDHPMILIDLFNARSVFFAPFHLDLPQLAQGNNRASIYAPPGGVYQFGFVRIESRTR